MNAITKGEWLAKIAAVVIMMFPLVIAIILGLA